MKKKKGKMNNDASCTTDCGGIKGCLINGSAKFLCHADCLFALLLLTIRVWMAKIFFMSGLAKIHNWEGTLILFRDEYRVPIIPYQLAAYLGTAVELSMPILLVLGIFSRVAALAMLVQTAVIAWVYPQYDEHIYWAFLLGTIFLYGPGCISADHWVVKKYCPIRGEKAGK